MRDGRYAIVFSADGYRGSGELTLEDNRGRGLHGTYQVDLLLKGVGPKLSGVATVTMESSEGRNVMIPRRYSVALTGVETEDAFSLIGIGPLGVIVELDARRSGDA